MKLEGDEIKELNISSTLLSRMFWKGEYLNPCPHKIKSVYLLSETYMPDNLNFIKGRYFEERTLGRGRLSEHTEIPLLKNGKKSADHARIDEAIDKFPLVVELYKLIITKNNVQVPLKQKIETTHKGIEFFATGTADLISPIEAGEFAFDSAVIDTKLTRDRNNEHGKYAWGKPQYIDHTQAVLYSELSGLPFFYLVFDYNAKDSNRVHSRNGHKLIPVMTVPLAEKMGYDYDDAEYILARQRRADLKSVIGLAIDKILMWHETGYEEIPSYDNCTDCPLNPTVNPIGTCRKANLIQQT